MRKMTLNTMTDQELALLKDRVEQVLIQRGVEIVHEDLLNALKEKGVNVDGTKVKFTKEQIDQAVASCPKEFTLASPSGKYDLTFPVPAEKGFYTRLNTGAPNFLTVDGDHHFVRLKEVEEMYHLTNQLENIDFIALTSTSAEDAPAEAIDVYTLQLALNKSQKHIWCQPYEGENVKHIIKMAQAAVGGAEELKKRPIISLISCSVPALTYKYMDSEVLYQAAKNFVPVQPCSLPTAGANTPVTGQGTAMLASAEVLAQIVILQLLAPGLPVIATPLLFSMDMMTTYTIQASPEITLGRIMAIQLFQQGYGIPAHSYGTGSDTFTIDGQHMQESTSLIHSMAFSGASVLGGAGQLETAKTVCPLALIIDNQNFGIARELVKGLEVTDEALAFEEIIAEEDKESGGFISCDHTFEHFSEIYRPNLYTRDSLVKWQMDGSKDFNTRVRERYDELMANEDTWHLDEDKSKAVAEALKEAHEALVKSDNE